LAIPIIIHLFHFRRFKKVYFTNVKFLKELKEETSNRNRIKNLLVLLSRLLALGFLVFAFAQPILFEGEEVKAGRKAVSVFVDNSFSMNATQNNAALLTIAKERARQIIQAYGESDEYQILTNELNGRQLNFFDKSTALSHIDEINSSPSVSDLALVRNVQKRTLSQKNSQKIAYLISDFQESISTFEQPVDSTVEYNLLQLRPVIERNISIDDVVFDAVVPVLNESNALNITLTNHSQESADNVQLSLLYEDQTRPLGTVSIPPLTTITDTAAMTINNTGWHDAEVRIEDYPVTFDDTYHIAFQLKQQINILSIYESQSNTYLGAAYKSLGYFNRTSAQKDRVKYEIIPTQDLIILEDLSNLSSGLIAVLEDFVSSGGNLLIFPSANINNEVYSDFLGRLRANNFGNIQKQTREVGRINSDAFIFSNVFRRISRNIKLPATSSNYVVNVSQSRAMERILDYRDGSSYLAKYELEAGSVYVCSAPLSSEYNDLSANAEIFIPLLYKAAISSGNQSEIAYTIGEDNIITSQNLDISEKTKYLITGGDTEFIPGLIRQKNDYLIDITDQINTAGIYNLTKNGNAESSLAFNYDRRESNLSLVNLEEIKNEIGVDVNIIEETVQAGLTDFISQKDHGFRLWKYCIMLALLFLAIETILLRFWKI
ncbi:MAG: BatA domain-containing protein, partial [Saprospiraceae bacterium]|nr:BatA domain-containing protein [Saprospiraceae bacterium]